MNTRTFICLKCGKKVAVSRETYAMIRENPMCEDCQSSCAQQEEGRASDGKDFFGEVTEVLSYGIQKLSDRLSSKQEQPSTRNDSYYDN